MNKEIYNILVIDDNPEDYATFRFFLERFNEFEYRFFREELGAKGIETCFEIKPDCVLLDYNLPDTDGLAVMKEINPDPLNPNFAVVFLTGSTSESLAVQGLKNGAQDYLRKDKITPEQLHLAISGAREMVALRKHAREVAEDLRLSQERLSLAVKGANIGTFDWNIKTNEIVWSSETEESSAMTTADFDNSIEGFLNFVHPADLDHIQGCLDEAFRTGDYECEFRMFKGDGTVRWVIAKGSVSYDENGEPARMTGVDIDITKRKEAEQHLHDSRIQTELALRAGNAIAFSWDVGSDQVRRLHSGIESLPETDVDTLNGVAAKIHEADREYFIANVKKALSQPHLPYNSEYRLLQADGSVIWLTETGKFTLDENGKAMRLVGISSEITKRKEAEELLRLSEEFNRTVLESSPDCVKIIDGDGRLQYMNQNGMRLMEIDDFEEYRGRFWWDLWGDESKPIVKDSVEKSLRGETSQFQAFCHTPAGTPKWWDVIVSPVLNGSQSGQIISVSRDITELKQVETERERLLERETELRRQAEDNNRVKEQFLAILSHELRTPLNAIFGWTQILETSGYDKAKTARGIEIIARNTRLQNALIEDLLDVSRIISGKMRLEKESMSLLATVLASVEAVQPAAQERAVKIVTDFDLNIDEVIGDKFRLQQVFNNLLSNAVKFTPAGGNVEVSLARDGETARFVVRDDGIGIAPDLLPYIFDRFRQADASAKREFGGLGLGLTIVKNLVEMHGGKVFAHSAGENRGAEFVVELPLVPQVRASASENPANDRSAGNKNSETEKKLAGKRILVVDDEQDSLDLLCYVLAESGAEVNCVNSAAAALDKIGKGDYDLLISDLGMPGKDGLDLIREVRHAEKDSADRLPALALTGYVSVDDRERVLEAGFQSHLPKPVNLEQLSEMVLKFVKR